MSESDTNVWQNSLYLEQLYEQYLKDPKSVDSSFHSLFQLNDSPSFVSSKDRENLSFKVLMAYRMYGHLKAAINPIEVRASSDVKELSNEALGIDEASLKKECSHFGIYGEQSGSLASLIEKLEKIYAKSIGYEYMYIENQELLSWIQHKIEEEPLIERFPLEQKKEILENLNHSELLESFIHTKYTGQKRFSLEGGETLIPMLSALLEEGAAHGQDTFMIGMAHRGRLNVLCNILNKTYEEVFTEFQDGFQPKTFEGSGDVKYHKGFSSKKITKAGKEISLNILPNPSHLESVDPVLLGCTRAIQDRKGASERYQVLPIMIHGDAAIAGQGVVYETMQMQNLPGYHVGGAIHIILNNQVGFTAKPEETRSTRYASDIAKAFEAPVFHVNAEDPESAVFVTLLALEIRNRFKTDVFIDLNCYRKYGHNETDEPSFTQPLEVSIIKEKQSIRSLYLESLIKGNILEQKLADSLEKTFKEDLKKALKLAESREFPSFELKTSERKRKLAEGIFDRIETCVSKDHLHQLAEKLSKVPEDFHIHKKLAALVETRKNMWLGKEPLDFGAAEILAYATILSEGKNIRLAGQDSARGTFSHRHAYFRDQENDAIFCPLNASALSGHITVVNSLLSEYAAMAFELGYSIKAEDDLVIWEAQFGDFANGAQIVIDQYLSPSYEKWGQRLGLTLFLPHGYEGQGPEHSSGRMERFLELCGDKNMVVVQPSSASQFFHLLRRQAHVKDRKPLVVFTPKALLRYPGATSSLSALTSSVFEEILDDDVDPDKIKTVLICSGKVRYDLMNKRKESKRDDLCILTIEQLYPLHKARLKELLEKYQKARSIVFVQEEPNNMGSWNFIRPRIRPHLREDQKLYYIGRARRASPATGSFALHKKEREAILQAVFHEEMRSLFKDQDFYNV